MRLIDADKLVNKFGGVDGWDMEQFQTDEIVEIIEEQPTIEAEPVRHGEWIEKMSILEDFIQGSKMHYCSCCGHEMMMSKYIKRKMNYCSNCGAKMEVKGNE